MTGRVARIASWAAVAAVIAIAVLAGFVRDSSGDFHWHVALGQHVLDEGALYLRDSHSHTYTGQPYFASSWLADVLLALAFSGGGHAGVYALRALALVVLAVCLLRDAAERGVPTAAAGVAVAFVFAQSLFLFYLRPETLVFGLFGALLLSLGRVERTASWRARLAVFAIILAWPNLHGSVSIALCAVGLASAQLAVRELLAGATRHRRCLAWAIATPPIAFGLACINPEGIAQPLAFRIVSEIWVQTVAEWRPLPLGDWPQTALALALAAAVTTLAALALRRRAAWWNLGLFLILCVFTLRYQRFLTWAMIAGAVVVMAHVAIIADAVRESTRPRVWRMVGIGTACVAAVWAALILLVDRRLLAEVGTGPDPTAPYHPQAACRFVADAAAPAPLFNSYPLGSYLIHCLGPSHPVFIDGRAWSLYSDEFYAHFRDAVTTPDRFRALIDEHPVGWAIVAYDPFALRLAEDTARWRLMYFDDTTLVYANVDHLATAELARGPAFRWLDPSRLIQLAELAGGQLDEARREIERQRARCPSCYRTLLAEAAIALTAGDDAAFVAARDRLLEQRESAEVAFLAARHALAHGDRAGAAVLFERFRALGGDPRIAARYLSGP